MTPLETEANPNIRVGPLRWGRPVEGIHISTLSNEEHEVKVVFKLPYVDDKLLKNKDNTFTPEPGTRTRDLVLTNSDSRYTPKKK